MTPKRQRRAHEHHCRVLKTKNLRESSILAALIVTETQVALVPRTNGAPGEVAQHARSPDSGHEQLCPCHVRRVFVAECLEHHPFLCTDTKRKENSKRH